MDARAYETLYKESSYKRNQGRKAGCNASCLIMSMHVYEGIRLVHNPMIAKCGRCIAMIDGWSIGQRM